MSVCLRRRKPLHDLSSDLSTDTGIFTPFGSRICVHNSTPVYLEMQSRSLDHHKREVKLTSLHVNVYYFCEEELRPRMHSVHLDTVNW